ncbi:MAG: Nif3-like dinuclear metal center hexameric protein, partial [Candidatus Borkfalkia sp.]
MKLENIYNILNAEIPHALSDRYVAAYGGHDNSGILLNSGEEIERAVFSLDLSRAAIERAALLGAKLIVTHHPAIYYPVSELSI